MRNGLPILTLEEAEQTRVRLDLDRILAPSDRIQGAKLARRGCQACLLYAERVADLIVWGSQPWYGDAYGYDYGWDRVDGVEVQFLLPHGEVLVQRIVVRAPNRLQDWATRGWQGSSSVIDARSAPAYPDGLEGEDVQATLASAWIDGRIYFASLFGEDFGGDFGG